MTATAAAEERCYEQKHPGVQDVHGLCECWVGGLVCGHVYVAGGWSGATLEGRHQAEASSHLLALGYHLRKPEAGPGQGYLLLGCLPVCAVGGLCEVGCIYA